MQGDIDHNSFSESEMRAVKRDTMGCKPNQQLDVSQNAITGHTSRRLTGISKNRKNELSQSEIDDIDGLEDLQFESKKALLEQYNLANNYCFCCDSENDLYFVKKINEPRVKNTDAAFFEESPKFWRTRTVTVVNINGRYFLNCSCGMFTKKGITCRHIYCLNDRKLSLHDCSLKHLKSHAVLYGSCKEHTKLCDDYHLQNQENNGPLTEFPIQLNECNKVEPGR